MGQVSTLTTGCILFVWMEKVLILYENLTCVQPRAMFRGCLAPVGPSDDTNELPLDTEHLSDAAESPAQSDCHEQSSLFAALTFAVSVAASFAAPFLSLS